MDYTYLKYSSQCLFMVYLPHWPIPYGKKQIDLGLERVREILKRLGDPHKKTPPVIHVAGTNGKGSTLAYLKSIFEQAGYKVHRYISPHIVRFNERICLAGEEINDDFLHQVIEETRLASDGLQTTFFEGTTAAAFLAFSKIPADIVLLETGLGGRLDATNLVDRPLATIITPISDDHTEYLGTTISQIASEKAGIIKNEVPCIISWQLEEAMEVLKSKCEESYAPSYICDRDWKFGKASEGFNFIDLEEDTKILLPTPSLLGIHQLVNASTAVAAISVISSLGFSFTYENVCEGLKNTNWPARMQNIKNGVLANILPPGWELWVDGAHNNGGAQMIAATIENDWNDKPTYLINGRTGERDIKSFLKHFLGKVEFVCGVKVRSEPLGELAENIVKGAKEVGHQAYECESIRQAIELILSKASEPSRILVCGSLYLVGDLLLANKELT